MVVHNRKIGAILGLIGSTILMIVGLFSLSFTRLYIISPVPIFVYLITGGVTVALAICGIVGSVLSIRGSFIAGYAMLIGAAAIGIFGTFFPIYAYDEGWGYIQYFYLCNTALYADLVPMLVGAILGYALVDNKERREF
ncbi:MAG: hypothetical protein ACXAC5_23175 [Promethearchaeota archaeon]|jgi:hypothetical protein